MSFNVETDKEKRNSHSVNLRLLSNILYEFFIALYDLRLHVKGVTDTMMFNHRSSSLVYKKYNSVAYTYNI